MSMQTLGSPSRQPPSPRARLPPRRPGPPRHPPDPAPIRPREMADRHRLRHHQPSRGPGCPRPPRRLDTRPLTHRSAAPHPRCHLRRRRLPGPNPQRPPGHGHPAQPGHRNPEARRLARVSGRVVWPGSALVAPGRCRRREDRTTARLGCLHAFQVCGSGSGAGQEPPEGARCQAPIWARRRSTESSLIRTSSPDGIVTS